MNKTTLLLPIIAVTFFACGPSKEEIAAREKFKMDSVAQATVDNIARQQEIADSTAAAALNQEQLKQTLVDLKAQLEAATVSLNDIEQYKILRSADEKAQQIEAQTKVVEDLKSQIQEIEKQITN